MTPMRSSEIEILRLFCNLSNTALAYAFMKSLSSLLWSILQNDVGVLAVKKPLQDKHNHPFVRMD
jgi:hypothetical protein